MSATRRLAAPAAVAVGLAATGWVVLGGGRPTTAGQPPAAPAKAPASAAPDERAADGAAVRMAVEAFAAAFNAGDAKALAALWTPAGEYVADDGATFVGRPALEKAYGEFFAKNPGGRLGVEVDEVRFPSRDTAVVEGHFKLRPAKGEPEVSRCSVLMAREDGRWLVAIAREWPDGGPSVRDLDWLIGTWEANRDGVAVTTTYEWTPNKSFVRCRFSLSRDGKPETGTQMIGRDPETGRLRSWTFEDGGGVGGAEITRDGNKWLHASRGVTADGRALTSTNVMTPVDADTFVWQAVERTLDGEPLPDLPPVRVVRVKAKP